MAFSTVDFKQNYYLKNVYEMSWQVFVCIMSLPKNTRSPQIIKFQLINNIFHFYLSEGTYSNANTQFHHQPASPQPPHEHPTVSLPVTLYKFIKEIPVYVR